MAPFSVSVMSNKLKNILLMIVALFALPLIVFLTIFFSTGGNYQVPATVSQDQSLPQVVLNQISFHVETFGKPENPPLLVLHDGPGGDYQSLLALKALADRYYVVFYDQRGSGLSARIPAEQLSIENSLKDVEAFVDHFAGDQPVSLIGHGWGGMLATAYTGKYPKRVERLILAEPGFLNTEMANQVLPLMNQASVGFLATTATSWVRALHVKGPDNEARSDFIFSRIRQHPAYYCGQKIPANASEQVKRAGFLAWRVTTYSTFGERGQIKLDFTKGLSDYKQPVLILAGACNTLTGQAFQTRQQRLFSNAGLSVIPESGHELFLDNPKASLSVVNAFLSSGKLPQAK